MGSSQTPTHYLFSVLFYDWALSTNAVFEMVGRIRTENGFHTENLTEEDAGNDTERTQAA